MGPMTLDTSSMLRGLDRSRCDAAASVTLVIPVVAVDVEAPSPTVAMQQVLMDACNASVTHLRCVPAREVKGQEPVAVAMISTPGPDVIVIELADAVRGEWFTRRLDFEAADLPTERWRSAGLSIGSLVGPADRPIEEERVSTPEDRGTRPSTPPAAAAATPFDMGIALQGIAGFGLERAAVRTGAQLGLWVTPWVSFAPHVAAGYSVATDVPDNLRLRFVDLSAGLGWHWSVSERWWGRLRAQVSLQNVRASASPSEPGLGAHAEEDTAWIPGVRAGVDGACTFARHWSAVLSLELLMQDGATQILVEDRRVAMVPALGALVGVGLEFGD